MGLLSPRDAYPLFIPRRRVVALAPGVVSILAPENPDRVFLLMVALSATILYSTDPAVTVLTGAQLPGGANPPLILRHVIDGAACCRGWFGISAGAAVALVIEEVIERWPRRE